MDTSDGRVRGADAMKRSDGLARVPVENERDFIGECGQRDSILDTATLTVLMKFTVKALQGVISRLGAWHVF
jgi:hypothetical protein